MNLEITDDEADWLLRMWPDVPQKYGDLRLNVHALLRDRAKLVAELAKLRAEADAHQSALARAIER